MSNRRRRLAATAVQQEPTSSGTDEVVWPSPIYDGEWVDADGIRWHRRGEGQPVTTKRVHQLLRSPEVRVLLFYGPDAPTEVASPDREALWQRMRPYLFRPVTLASKDHTFFNAAEFKDDRRRLLLVIEEHC